METPDEVAAAKAEFFDALEARVERFARGADLSKRYVRELRAWLAEHHGGDERVERVIAVLREYRATVGQTEAREACHDLVVSFRREVEGERFAWRSVPDERDTAWRDAFAIETPAVELPAACPLCGRTTLRRYFRRYDYDRGGGWEWCGSCLGFQHHGARVPAWWEGSPLLDAVPISVLEHSPEFLERALRLADDGVGHGDG